MSKYKRAGEFSGFFKKKISGDRKSTIAFENYFRENAPNNIEVFFEVVFWKLYSLAPFRDRKTNRIVDYVKKEENTAEQIWKSVQQFVNSPKKTNLRIIRAYLGLTSRVLATPLTLVAFANPDEYPMVDNRVAEWVNQNFSEHNTNRKNKLTPFTKKRNTLRDDDFLNYLNWVNWCQECAQVLTKRTNNNWRPRDVEMAVFTAQEPKEIMNLNVLPLRGF